MLDKPKLASVIQCFTTITEKQFYNPTSHFIPCSLINTENTYISLEPALTFFKLTLFLLSTSQHKKFLVQETIWMNVFPTLSYGAYI